MGGWNIKIILEIKFSFFFYFTENYSRRVRKSTSKKILALIRDCTYRGQKYFNIALALQDEWLTIFTRPANTCTRPLKLLAIFKKMGGGGGGNDVLSLLKWYLPCQFHNCIPYTDKKNLTFNTHDPVAKLPWQVVICFTVCVISILAGTFVCQTLMKTKPFDWFINLLRLSTFSYQEEKSMITAIQSVTIQTYFIDENALQKSIFTSMQSTTLPHIILRSFYLPFAITTSGFYFWNWKGI